MRSASWLTRSPRSREGRSGHYGPSCRLPCVLAGHGLVVADRALGGLLVGVEAGAGIDPVAVAEAEPPRRRLDVLVATAGEVHQEQRVRAEFLAEHHRPGQGVRGLDRRDDAL